MLRRSACCQVDLSSGVNAILDVALLAQAGLPPGTSKVAIGEVNKVLSPIGSKLLTPILQDKMAKPFIDMSSLQGKKARVVYRNGKGLETITPIECSLTSQERGWFEDLSMISDIAIMESLECQPGDKWLVPAKDFIPVIDPSLEARCTGSVTIQRDRDLGDGSNPSAVLKIAGGVIEFRDRFQGDSHEIEEAARWAPEGKLVFEFDKGIVTWAKLGGSIDYTERSMNHLLFEMKHTQKPNYSVTYSAWISDGPAQKPELMKPPANVLNRLKSLQR